MGSIKTAMASKVLKPGHVRCINNASNLLQRQSVLQPSRIRLANFSFHTGARHNATAQLITHYTPIIGKFAAVASGLWLLKHLGKEAICADSLPETKIFEAVKRNDIAEFQR